MPVKIDFQNSSEGKAVQTLLTDVIAPAQANVPAQVTAAGTAMVTAAETYAAEVADVEANWARLVAGAAAERLRIADEVFDAALSVNFAGGQTVSEVEAARLREILTPTPPTKSEDVRLARDEIILLVGNAGGGKLAGKLHDIAKSPRLDLTGVILSPWGESLAAARDGINTSDWEMIRAAAVASAAVNGTPAQVAAGAKLATLPKDTYRVLGGYRVVARTIRDWAARSRRNRLLAGDLADTITTDAELAYADMKAKVSFDTGAALNG